MLGMAVPEPPSGANDRERVVIERLALRGIVITAKQAGELAAAAVRLQQMKDLLRLDVGAPDDSVRGLQRSK